MRTFTYELHSLTQEGQPRCRLLTASLQMQWSFVAVSLTFPLAETPAPIWEADGSVLSLVMWQVALPKVLSQETLFQPSSCGLVPLNSKS